VLIAVLERRSRAAQSRRPIFVPSPPRLIHP
jgi:hypothetical protein